MNKRINEFVSCPYNPQHLVLRSRMPYHLVKCQKTYTGETKKRCPFNAQHILSLASFESHVLSCPDSVRLDRNICMSRTQKSTINAPQPSRTLDDEFEWEDEIPS